MKKNILGAASLVTAGLLAGGIISLAGSANAADAASTTALAATNQATPAPLAPSFGSSKSATDGAFDPGGADPVRSDEKAVAADLATKLKTAAEAAVSGATAFRVETDGDGATYEVHLKKADGTLVTVKFDTDLKITATEDGMGKGGKGGHGLGGDHDRDHDGDHSGGRDGDGPHAEGFTAPTPSTGSGS